MNALDVFGSSSYVAPWPSHDPFETGNIFSLPGKNLLLRLFLSFLLFFHLFSGIPCCLGGSRQNGFPSADFVPTPLGHLVSLGNSCCCFGRGQKAKGHVLGRWLAGLTLVISVCLLSLIDCLCCSPQIVCSLHTAFMSYPTTWWGGALGA